jgi:nuclear pore complex protein Nup62
MYLNIWFVCRYILAYIHACMHTYTYIHIRTQRIHTHTYTYIRIHTHTYAYVYIHTYTFVYIHIYIYVCMYVCNVCMYVCLCVYVCMYMYVYVFTTWYMCKFECDQTRAQILFVWHSGLSVGKVYKSHIFFIYWIFRQIQSREMRPLLPLVKGKKRMIWPNRCFGESTKESKILISPISQEKTYCFELLHVTGKRENKTLISLNIRKEKTYDD